MKPTRKHPERTLPASALIVALFSTPGAATAQIPDAGGASLVTEAESELAAIIGIQDETDPSRLLRLVEDFERTHPDSEYRHLALRMRWQAIRESGAGPDAVIDAAREALAAQDRFLNESAPVSNTVAYDLGNQEALFHGSIADAFVALGDGRRAIDSAELGLAAVDRSWDRYVRDNPAGGPDSGGARELRDRMLRNFLEILVQGYQDAGDGDRVIDYGRRYLAVAPDDVRMLLYVSGLMAQRPPRDGSLAQHLAAAERYAASALPRVEALADVGEAQKTSLLAGAHLTLGIVWAQQGKLDAAVESLAQAVTLNSGQRQARTILENVYAARHGSLDGLDDYVRNLDPGRNSPASESSADSTERARPAGGRTVPVPAERPVAEAAKAGDRARVRRLVASGADVDTPTADGSTPVIWAVYNFDAETAADLVAAGADVNVPNDYGVTPLLQAARTGDARMTALLLDAGADPERAHPEGETPLMAAARAGSVRSVRRLIDRGADVNAVGGVGDQTALMWAAAEGHADVVDTLLLAGADPDVQARVTSLATRRNADFPTGGFTALMWAARNGDEETVRRLADGGANLDLQNGDGASATMIAIYNDRFDTARTLIELGAGVDDGSLFTAVEMRRATTDQYAFDGSRLRPDHPNELTALNLIRLLLERGANPHRWFTGQFHSTSMPNSDRFSSTPFLRAAFAADVEALKVFVDHVSDLDAIPVVPDDLWCHDAATGLLALSCNPHPGRTATMLAITGGRGPDVTGGPAYFREGDVPYREPGSRRPEDALRVLLEAGASPDSAAPGGATLLHQAVRAGSLGMIRTLARFGADLERTDDDGLTALEAAENGGEPLRDAWALLGDLMGRAR